MSKIDWHDSFNINVSQVDDQHKQLLIMARALHEAMRTRNRPEFLLKRLDDLLEYTRMHFAFEETLMIEHQYPGRESHQREHSELLNRAIGLRDALASGKQLAGTDSFNASDDWVLAHVAGADRKLGAFLNDIGVY